MTQLNINRVRPTMRRYTYLLQLIAGAVQINEIAFNCIRVCGCLCTRTKSNKSSRASQRAPIHLKFFYVAKENKKLYARSGRTSSVATAILPKSIPSSLVGFRSAISLRGLVATASNIRYNDM